MKKWFRNVTTIEELRTKYKMLLRQHHPDNGGDLHIMQEINAEYEVVFAILKHQNTANSESSNEQETEEDTALRAVLNEIISFNMEIEIIGSWIWCFNSYPYKDKLKALGFKYAPKKKLGHGIMESTNVMARKKILMISVLNTVHREFIAKAVCNTI